MVPPSHSVTSVRYKGRGRERERVKKVGRKTDRGRQREEGRGTFRRGKGRDGEREVNVVLARVPYGTDPVLLSVPLYLPSVSNLFLNLSAVGGVVRSGRDDRETLSDKDTKDTSLVLYGRDGLFTGKHDLPKSIWVLYESRSGLTCTGTRDGPLS